MNTNEFINKLYDKGRFKFKKDVKVILNFFFEELKKSLAIDNKLTLKNIGTFTLYKCEKKEVWKLKFKASNNLIKELNSIKSYKK